MKKLKHIRKFEELENNIFTMDDMKNFSEWCLSNKRYKYDTNGKFWFDSKTLTSISWDDIFNAYNN